MNDAPDRDSEADEAEAALKAEWGFSNDEDEIFLYELSMIERRNRQDAREHPDRRVRELSRAAAAAAASLGCRDPKIALNRVAVLRHILEEITARQVGHARSLHWSWRDVADALGLSRQTVFRKYASEEKAYNVRQVKPPQDVGRRARTAKVRSNLTAWRCGYGKRPEMEEP